MTYLRKYIGNGSHIYIIKAGEGFQAVWQNFEEKVIKKSPVFFTEDEAVAYMRMEERNE